MQSFCPGTDVPSGWVEYNLRSIKWAFPSETLTMAHSLQQISLTQGGLLSCKFINFHMNESQQSQQLASMMSLSVYMSINKHLLSTL